MCAHWSDSSSTLFRLWPLCHRVPSGGCGGKGTHYRRWVPSARCDCSDVCGSEGCVLAVSLSLPRRSSPASGGRIGGKGLECVVRCFGLACRRSVCPNRG